MNTLLTLKFAAWVVIIEIAFTDDYNKKENKRRCCWQLEEKNSENHLENLFCFSNVLLSTCLMLLSSFTSSTST